MELARDIGLGTTETAFVTMPNGMSPALWLSGLILGSQQEIKQKLLLRIFCVTSKCFLRDFRAIHHQNDSLFLVLLLYIEVRVGYLLVSRANVVYEPANGCRGRQNSYPKPLLEDVTS